MDEKRLTDMDPQLVTLGGILASLAGSWGVTRYQASLNAAQIGKLEESKAALTADVAKLDKEIAVLRSKSEDADRRMTEALTTIRETISQSEARVISHFDASLKAIADAVRAEK